MGKLPRVILGISAKAARRPFPSDRESADMRKPRRRARSCGSWSITCRYGGLWSSPMCQPIGSTTGSISWLDSAGISPLTRTRNSGADFRSETAFFRPMCKRSSRTGGTPIASSMSRSITRSRLIGTRAIALEHPDQSTHEQSLEFRSDDIFRVIPDHFPKVLVFKDLLVNALQAEKVLTRERRAMALVEIHMAADGSWQVRLPPLAKARLQLLRDSLGPNETGGALLGIVDHSRKRIEIVSGLRAPVDSVSGRTGFERGIRGLRVQIDKACEKVMHQVTYIGEWHNHSR
ncbi:hypothetical protein SAMN05878426_102636 [Phaeovulum vinaykumarii]|uniref:Uncharacterized protein n=1 Tax=Phaeovulum vinaykumarii TaxID=407234 RepID=A0A1N7KT52_9RHOB|nr:hypothetical protein SAMN05421795_102138 [Phaeovulum vinaykumarii]SOC01501.1 hypothetical protein SAMN05878426_102636 [Phaeovulum vinaykumarii]